LNLFYFAPSIVSTPPPPKREAYPVRLLVQSYAIPVQNRRVYHQYLPVPEEYAHYTTTTSKQPTIRRSTTRSALYNTAQ